MKNIVTKKFKYNTDENSREIILEFIKNYNNALRYTFNRVKENPAISTKELSALHRQLNNIFVDSHFLGSAIYEAKTLYKVHGDKSIIFGGKKLLKEREKGSITSGEWKLHRLLPLCNIGKASGNGNTKFQIINSFEILFKPVEFKSLRELYYFIKQIKNSKQRYRVSLEELSPSRVLSKFYCKKKIILYSFI